MSSKLPPPWDILTLLHRLVENKPAQVEERIRTLEQYCDVLLHDPQLLVTMQNYLEGYANTPAQNPQNLAMTLGATLKFLISESELSGYYTQARQRLLFGDRQALGIIQVFEMQLVTDGLLDENKFKEAWGNTEEYNNIPTLKDYLLSKLDS